jgi:hypothetical protein
MLIVLSVRFDSIAEKAQITQAKRNVNKDPIVHVDNSELIVKTRDADAINGHHHNDCSMLDDLTLTNNNHENIVSKKDDDGKTVATTTTATMKDYSWFRGVHNESTLIVYKAPMQGWNTIAGEGKERK